MEGGTECTTSCLDPLLTSSVMRHSEGHGCLWMCLCQAGHIRGASLYVWHQKKAARLTQTAYITPPGFLLLTLRTSVLPLSTTPLFSEAGGMCLHQQSPIMSIAGEFKLLLRSHFVLRCKITTKLIGSQKQP